MASAAATIGHAHLREAVSGFLWSGRQNEEEIPRNMDSGSLRGVVRLYVRAASGFRSGRASRNIREF